MTIIQRYGLEKLTDDERRELIRALFQGLPEDDLGLTPEQFADLNERLDEDDADPDSGFTLEEVKAYFKTGR